MALRCLGISKNGGQFYVGSVMTGSQFLAVFDCDGTLVDSQHSIIGAMHAAFDANAIPRATADQIRRVVGLPLVEAIQILHQPVPDDEAEKIRADYSDAWQAMHKNGGLDEPLYEGTVEVLEALSSAGWTLGVATGKSMRGLVGTLEKHEILGRFATLQTADRARGKPHPEMLERAMGETGARPEKTVMIGDTTFDMEMAANARVPAVGVAWGYHDSEELKSAGARTVVRSYPDLPDVLAALMEETL